MLLAGHALHLRDAVRGTGVWRRGHTGPDRAGIYMQAPARDEHSRTDHGAAIDEVAHGDVVVVRGAEIANARHAGLQRLAGIFLCEEYGDRVAECAELGPGVRAGRVVPVERHVRVDVDETGQAGVFSQVHDRRAGWDRAIACPDRRDALPFDDDDRIPVGLTTGIDQPSEADRGDLCERIRRSRDEESGDQHEGRDAVHHRPASARHIAAFHSHLLDCYEGSFTAS